MPFEPPPVASSPEELLGWQIEELEVELRRVEQRLRSVSWGAPSPRRLSLPEQWAVFSRTLEPVDHGASDGIV